MISLLSLRNRLLALLLLPASIAIGQQAAYESPAGTKFLLYTPPGYTSSTAQYPLLLSLHSKGEVGDDLVELTSKNPEQMPSRLIYLNRWPSHLPFIVLTPQLKPTAEDPDPQWPADYIDEVVRYVTANFRVDLKRIYVTGISRGGTGAWTYASAYPEKVAALLPMSGRSDLAQACAIKDIPVWALHGDGDDVAPVEYSIDMVDAIKKCQPSGVFTPRLNILHAREHDGWNEVYNGSSGYKVYEWLLMFSKNDLSNKKPYVNAGPDRRVSLETTRVHLAGDFFDSDGSIAQIQWSQTKGSTLTLSNSGTAYLAITDLAVGSFEFELAVTDNDGAVSRDRVLLDIVENSFTPQITQLILVDGKTNEEIGPLSDGMTINKAALGLTEINVRAITSDGTGSVRFSVNTDQNTRTLNPAPYYIKRPSNFPEWEIEAGVYLICATPYAKTYASGPSGASLCYKVTVIESGITTCAGSGGIKAETWTGVPGTDIASIPLTTAPSSVRDLTLFETPRNIGDNYGTRVRGYLCVPASGAYIFWIATDDKGELWLSTDENPANKTRIAYVSGWTKPREWTKYTSQQSVAINLVAGRRYYIEALVKEASGGDHLSVGWQLPDGTLERPVAGSRLVPYGEDGDNESGSACAATGHMEMEVWTGISGRNISSIPLDSPPNSIMQINSFETIRNIGDDYGSRVRGYLCVPETGAYTFWIASDDTGELWLSTNENAANKARIAYVSGWTYARQWDKYTTQQSAAITLVAGQKYYVEALLKEGGGGDNLAVGWQLPNGALERPIPGTRISEFETEALRTQSTSSVTSISSISLDDRTLRLYPNPVPQGSSVLISGVPESYKGQSIRVQVVAVTGEPVYSEWISSDALDNYLIAIPGHVSSGVYLLTVHIDGRRIANRLLVK